MNDVFFGRIQLGILCALILCMKRHVVFGMLKLKQVLVGEEKEQERERNNSKSSTLFNPAFPNIFDLGTLFSQITFNISQKKPQETNPGQVALFGLVCGKNVLKY